MKIAIINGPNLNLLGQREPGIYGSESFDSFLQQLRNKFTSADISYFQSNVEGELVTEIQRAGSRHSERERNRPRPGLRDDLARGVDGHVLGIQPQLAGEPVRDASDRVGGRVSRARDIDEDNGRALTEVNDLERGAARQSLARPSGEELRRSFDVAMLAPARVERS